jgi:hypothetical protein
VRQFTEGSLDKCEHLHTQTEFQPVKRADRTKRRNGSDEEQEETGHTIERASSTNCDKGHEKQDKKERSTNSTRLIEQDVHRNGDNSIAQ